MPAAAVPPAAERPDRARPAANAVVGVGVVVVDADGRVLLGQAHDGRWELPGGKTDPGEGFAEAAARELAEETSLLAEPSAVRVLAVLVGAKAGVVRLTAAVVTDSAAGAPRVTEPDKILRWSWFEPSAIPTGLYGPSATVLHAWRPELGLDVAHVPSHVYRLADA
ncbi:NUDIX domain-containing protein [Streptomyces bambusae]|uniref:NUDIX domain-containing protein n=1 Tax=Streptomyces bambusae TaxID=1550616 RepID=UPI001CFE19F2|nr:NUDIX domain-containing protein [Streptomyces bambusae]MCB5163988.1 NUDIX domain-containing protein [Streptomyces bambusae]